MTRSTKTPHAWQIAQSTKPPDSSAADSPSYSLHGLRKGQVLSPPPLTNLAVGRACTYADVGYLPPGQPERNNITHGEERCVTFRHNV